MISQSLSQISNKAAGEEEVIWGWINPGGLQATTSSWPYQLPT